MSEQSNDRIERMRRKQQGGVRTAQAPVATATQVAPAEQAQPNQKPARKAATGPRIKFACGHERSLDKVAHLPCQTCLDAARAEARRTQHERRLQKVARRREKKEDETRASGRLPDGSSFAVSYDAAAERWSGTLTIPPGDSAAVRVFTASASGVFNLLRALDGTYREWCAESGDPQRAVEAHR